MKKKKSLLLFLAATSASFVQAALPVHTSFAAGIENVQEKGHTFIKGRVIDSDGNPLVGVTVQIEGTSYGVITNADGNYILEFPSMAHPKIVFSSIGYKSKSIEFRGVKEQKTTSLFMSLMAFLPLWRIPASTRSSISHQTILRVSMC